MKQKIFKGIVSFLLPATLLAAPSGSPPNPSTKDLPKFNPSEAQAKKELRAVDDLIEATTESLNSQKSLRTLMLQYVSIRNHYMEDMKDREAMLEMVKTAYLLLERIQENHLTHIFDPDFLSELSFFSQIAAKRGIPRP